PNEVHSVGGEPEAMKSWLLLYAAVQEIKHGHHVFYLDMEANDRSIVDRLMLMGALNWSQTWYRPGGRLNPRAIARKFIALLRQGQEVIA
ncbi:MAG: hypothetical protein ABI409_18550, partial [Ramlibacter sp.]